MPSTQTEPAATTYRQRVKALKAEGIFLGGPPPWFEKAGRKILMTLLNDGLTTDAKVLDIGCGCLRGGYWLIHFLKPSGYCGIEPNRAMLQAGLDVLLEADERERKAPRFDYNDRFDFTVFDEQFDFYVARSVWTHAAKPHIETMLDGFVETSSERAVFLASYQKPTLFNRDYKGTEWIGKSHESDEGGIVRHSFRWIRKACAARGLTVRELKVPAYNFGLQTWLQVRRDHG